MTEAAREVFDQAVALQGAGDLEGALSTFQRAQELDPKDTEIAYRAASALLQTGQLDEALSQLRRIVFADPDHLQARASLANCQLLLGDTETALQNFRNVLAKAPDNINALYGMAKIMLGQKQAVEAARTVKRLLELLPGSCEVLTLFAETQQETGRSAAAIANYRKALALDADYAPALVGLIKCLTLARRFDEAVALALKLIEQQPDDPYPLELLSDVLAAKGAVTDAIEAVEAALAISPKSTQLHTRLSVLKRRNDNAIASLKHALEAHDLDTTNQEALKAMGAAFAALKLTEAAREVLTGHAKGLSLDKDIRALATSLIAGEKVADPSPAETESNSEPQAEAEAPEQKSASGDLELSDDNEDLAQPAAPRPAVAANAPIPNVLGLRKRDES